MPAAPTNRRQAVANPWGAKSLEWMVPTPVPLENFEEVPVVASGPYNYGEPVDSGQEVAGPAGQAAG